MGNVFLTNTATIFAVISSLFFSSFVFANTEPDRYWSIKAELFNPAAHDRKFPSFVQACESVATASLPYLRVDPLSDSSKTCRYGTGTTAQIIYLGQCPYGAPRLVLGDNDHYFCSPCGQNESGRFSGITPKSGNQCASPFIFRDSEMCIWRNTNLNTRSFQDLGNGTCRWWADAESTGGHDPSEDDVGEPVGGGTPPEPSTGGGGGDNGIGDGGGDNPDDSPGDTPDPGEGDNPDGPPDGCEVDCNDGPWDAENPDPADIDPGDSGGTPPDEGEGDGTSPGGSGGGDDTNPGPNLGGGGGGNVDPENPDDPNNPGDGGENPTGPGDGADPGCEVDCGEPVPEPEDPTPTDPNEPDPNLPDPNEPDPNQPDPNEPDPNEPDPNNPGDGNGNGDSPGDDTGGGGDSGDGSGDGGTGPGDGGGEGDGTNPGPSVGGGDGNGSGDGGDGSGEGGGGDCDPATEECGDGEASVSGTGTCGTPPTCEGDVLQCERIHQEWLEYCAWHPDNVSSALNNSAAFQQLNEGAGTEEDGSLTYLNPEEVDVSEEFSFGTMFSDQGRGGDCPAPYHLPLSRGDHFFDYQPICDTATGIRPIVILAAVFLGGLMFYRGLIENG